MAEGASRPRLRWGVVYFPGTNCDLDTLHALGEVMGQDAVPVWHEERSLDGLDAVVIAGGFAHGDYLRAGAIARFSPVMSAVEEFAAGGRPVLGICNGFQVLLEAGLLPGAMLRNRQQRFCCRWTHLRVEAPAPPFLNRCSQGQVIRLPMAHGEGNYYNDPDEIAQMEARGQVLLRYCEADGTVSRDANPNGSVGNIAAICSEAGNVMGLMPHPERATEPILGGSDGRLIWESIIESRRGGLVSR